MNNTVYMLWLQQATTPVTAQKLLKSFKTAENIYNATDYSKIPRLSGTTEKKLRDKNISKAMGIYSLCTEKNIHIIPYGSTKYPTLLKEIPDPPTVLYAKGIIPDWDSLFTVAVVGTRKISAPGRSITEKLCKGLIKAETTIVSGFAEGVDTVAAQTSVNENNFTVAVLGCGVDVVYPASNATLYPKVLKNGVFLSEYPPGTKPLKFFFPQRNRIIVGLSRGVIVTQAPQKSGSVITGELALKYNRDLFAVPIEDEGTNLLISLGAKRVTEAKEITDNYRLNLAAESKLQTTVPNPIISLLEKCDMTIDDICVSLNISMSECNFKCFMLELEGKIKKLPGGFYHCI